MKGATKGAKFSIDDLAMGDTATEPPNSAR